MPESELATLFQSLKQIPDVKNLAETMQNYQFRLWISQREKPDNIAAVLGIPNGTPIKTEADSRYEILKDFTAMFNKAGGRK